MRSPAVPTAAVVTTASRAASSAMSAIASTVRAIGSSFELAAPVEPLAEPRHLGPVDDRPPLAVLAPLADHELDRVGADVDHGEAAEREELLQALRDADVRPEVEPELAHRRGHERRILGLDGDRPQNAPVRAQLGELGHRAADGYVPAPLVHVDREQLGSRVDELAEELLERVLGSLERVLDRERRQHRLDIGSRHRKAGLQHGLPLLEPVLVDALELLHVQQPAAHLDRRVARDREQVQVIALLLELGRQLTEAGLGVPEALAEGAPLPPGCDPRARRLSSRS